MPHISMNLNEEEDKKVRMYAAEKGISKVDAISIMIKRFNTKKER